MTDRPLLARAPALRHAVPSQRDPPSRLPVRISIKLWPRLTDLSCTGLYSCLPSSATSRLGPCPRQATTPPRQYRHALSVPHMPPPAGPRSTCLDLFGSCHARAHLSAMPRPVVPDRAPPTGLDQPQPASALPMPGLLDSSSRCSCPRQYHPCTTRLALSLFRTTLHPTVPCTASVPRRARVKPASYRAWSFSRPTCQAMTHVITGLQSRPSQTDSPVPDTLQHNPDMTGHILNARHVQSRQADVSSACPSPLRQLYG
jgi:hypothetical protein